MNIFKKLFCDHKWKSYKKSFHEWETEEIVPGTKRWYKPRIQIQRYTETTEILICEKCGKIEKVKY